MNFGIHHTFTARLFINGMHFRPGNPNGPDYRLYTLPDQRRVFIDPNLPECADRGICAIVQAFEVPAELLENQILV